MQGLAKSSQKEGSCLRGERHLQDRGASEKDMRPGLHKTVLCTQRRQKEMVEILEEIIPASIFFESPELPGFFF